MSGSRSLTRPLGAAAVLILLAVCLLALGLRLEGDRWFVVRTPSMGRAAPVGTLLVTSPVSASTIHEGDIVTFRAPTSGTVYTHRVVERTASGLRTRGDVNPEADPWVLKNAGLIGKVTHRWWGCGWILRGVPLLLALLAVLWLGTAFSGDRWRSALRVVGSALSFAAVATYLRPWVGIDQLGIVAGSHGPVIRVVSVGVLPIKASVQHSGDHAQLVDGQVAGLWLHPRGGRGASTVYANLSLSPGWWIAIAFVCLTPLLWVLVVGLPPVEISITEIARSDAPDTTMNSAPLAAAMPIGADGVGR